MRSTRRRQQASSVPKMMVTMLPEMSGSDDRSAMTVMRHVPSITTRSSTVARAMAAMKSMDRYDLSRAPPANIMTAKAQWQQSMRRPRHLELAHRCSGKNATMAAWKAMAMRKKGLSNLQGTRSSRRRHTSANTTAKVIAPRPWDSRRSLRCSSAASRGPRSADAPPRSRELSANEVCRAHAACSATGALLAWDGVASALQSGEA
mmetsp:Transcript_56185/g.147749  ORF Transcript_56185/g.147749 Transcript_56185/m.147749 type:complete len:205 (+) Transcript_56185:132-746(+)